ncbi:hypothetical protein CEXT_804131 [Caerostris extrusa]|uniref:Uncharacterized protein n=1 Tax=Caerostris extrusa TaxID=172846 RepID=A0AAV4N5A4_CAEEX|nr:hypothetical protein CEXT_804131 [Caerostris extrusa]
MTTNRNDSKGSKARGKILHSLDFHSFTEFRTQKGKIRKAFHPTSHTVHDYSTQYSATHLFKTPYTSRVHGDKLSRPKWISIHTELVKLGKLYKRNKEKEKKKRKAPHFKQRNDHSYPYLLHLQNTRDITGYSFTTCA